MIIYVQVVNESESSSELLDGVELLDTTDRTRTAIVFSARKWKSYIHKKIPYE